MTLFLENECNWDSFPTNFQKPFKMYIEEIIPMIRLSDGFHFIEAVFTKESINSFRKLNSHLRLSDLVGRVVQLNKWELFVRQKNSRVCHNSCSNIAVYLLI